MKKIIVIIFLVAIGGVIWPSVAHATYTCEEIGKLFYDNDNYEPGDCYIDTCNGVQGCYCDVAPNTDICCSDFLDIGGGGCFNKETGELKGGSIIAADATAVDDPYVKDLIKADRPVFFVPQITIPGSKFIAGQAVEVDFSTMGEYIAALYIFLIGAAGVLAAVMIVWGGIQYITSFGQQNQISQAKDTISSALIGLVIAIGSYVILVTISPNLVQFKGLDLKYIGVLPEWEAEVKMASQKGAPPVTWDLTTNVQLYDADLLQAASNNVPDGMSVQNFRNWMKAVMMVESAGNPRAKSNAGACGLMQLLPSTAQDLLRNGDPIPPTRGITCNDLRDNPGFNIELGARYLKSLHQLTCPPTSKYKSGKVVQCKPEKTNCENGLTYPYVIAAYNGGRGANCHSIETNCDGQTWWECVKNSGYAETRHYVLKVKNAYDTIVANGW